MRTYRAGASRLLDVCTAGYLGSLCRSWSREHACRSSWAILRYPATGASPRLRSLSSPHPSSPFSPTGLRRRLPHCCGAQPDRSGEARRLARASFLSRQIPVPPLTLLTLTVRRFSSTLRPPSPPLLPSSVPSSPSQPTSSSVARPRRRPDRPRRDGLNRRFSSRRWAARSGSIGSAAFMLCVS